MIAWSLWRLLLIARTNSISILIRSIGKVRNRLKDEYPVPKSSIAIEMPSSFIFLSCSMMNGSSWNAILSVISTSTLWGGVCVSLRIAAICSTMEGSRSWISEMLILMESSRPAHSLNCWICWQAVLITHSPKGLIIPVCSAMGMNTSGLTTPYSLLFHLSKASKPIILLVSNDIFGWYSKCSSSLSSAQ